MKKRLTEISDLKEIVSRQEKRIQELEINTINTSSENKILITQLNDLQLKNIIESREKNENKIVIYGLSENITTTEQINDFFKPNEVNLPVFQNIIIQKVGKENENLTAKPRLTKIDFKAGLISSDLSKWLKANALESIKSLKFA